MGAERLGQVKKILMDAGIACCEEYAPAPARYITHPVAAVGIRSYDWEAGIEIIAARVQSPRKKGGWACQCTAVQAAQALNGAGLSARVEKMEYRSGSDCFEMPVLCTLRIGAPVPVKPRGWTVAVDGTAVDGVTEFSAVREGRSRLIGSVGTGLPSAVIPAKGGWQLRMVQKFSLQEEPQALPAAPGQVAVHRNGGWSVYLDVLWDQTGLTYTGEGLTVEYRGFALKKEEKFHG